MYWGRGQTRKETRVQPELEKSYTVNRGFWLAVLSLQLIVLGQ